MKEKNKFFDSDKIIVINKKLLKQLIREVVGEVLAETPAVRKTPNYHHTFAHDDIEAIKILVDKVGKALDIETKVFYAGSSSRVNSWPRQIVMYLLQVEFGWGTRKAANAFWKVHGTAVRAKKVVEDRMETEVKVRILIDSLRSKV